MICCSLLINKNSWQIEEDNECKKNKTPQDVLKLENNQLQGCKGNITPPDC